MGLQHDRYTACGGDPSCVNWPYPYSYGYVNQRPFYSAGAPKSAHWRTIMAYWWQCEDEGVHCSQLLRFSNPRQSWDGDPLGVPGDRPSPRVDGPSDAVRTLDNTRHAIAGFRDRVPGANRPPVAVGALPDRGVELDGTLELDVSHAFADPDGDALTYTVSPSAPGVVAAVATGARVTLTGAGIGTSAIRVTATDAGGSNTSATQTFRVTVFAPFTDHPIVPGETPVRAVHFTELRTVIDALREASGLAGFAWTDPVLAAGVTPIRLVHLLELREALGEAYAAAGRSAPVWTDAAPVGGTTPIRAAHLMELRAAVLAPE